MEAQGGSNRGTLVAIALGSNLGDRAGILLRAVEELDCVLCELRSTEPHETKPMYLEDQPSFLNAVVIGRTLLGPWSLLRRLKRLEAKLGRVERDRYGPREIDLDLILYGSLELVSEHIVVPHPRLAERRFVLEPLAELAPELRVPGLGPVRRLLAALKR